ncbi:MAG: hypothetical protein MK098_10010 [Marinovum sp.]|nr:hypothetical protein [Marinovum sp.]
MIETCASLHQAGIRQRSLRKHCRLGRATELVFIMATGATVVLSTGAATAQQTWIDGNADNDWNLTDPNWDGGVNFTNGNGAIFQGTAETVTIDEAGGVQAADVTFNVDGYTIDGNDLDVTGTLGVTTDAQSATISTNIANGLTVGGEGTVNLSGTIGGDVIINATGADVNFSGSSVAGSLTTSGTGTSTIGAVNFDDELSQSAGTLNITGAATFNNTGTDESTISGGTLNVDAATNFGGTVNLSSGATYDQNAAVTGNISTASTNADIGANVTGTLDVTGGSTTISGPSTITGAISANAGTLTLGNSVSVSADGNLTVGDSGTGNGIVNLADSAALTGDMTVNSDGTLNTNANSTITGDVSNSGIFDLTGDANVSGDVTNSGTIQSSAAGDELTINGTNGVFTSQGTIDGSTGDLTITATEIELRTGHSTTGTVSLSATTLDYGIDADISGSLTSNIVIQSGSELDVTGDTTITAADAITDMVVEGTLDIEAGNRFEAGSIQNDGTIEVRAGSTLAGTDNTLTNNAALNVADGGTVTDAGAIINNTTGTITFAGDATFDADDNNDSGGTDFITNEGSIVVNAGAGSTTQTVAVGSDALTNQNGGTLDINSGTINGITTLTNTSTSASAIDVASGATLDADTVASSAGTITNAGDIDAAVNLTGSAALDVNSGTITGNLNVDTSGSVTLTGTVTGTLEVDSGVADVDGASTITGAITVGDGSGTANTAELEVSTGITLTASGNTTVSGSDGLLDVDGTLTGNVANAGNTDNDGSIGGSVTNTGTLTHAGGIGGSLTQNTGGNTTVDGAAATVTGLVDINNGTLNITNGNQLTGDSGGTLTTDVDIASGGTLDIDSGGTLVGNVSNASSSASINDGTLTGDVANSGSFDNNNSVSGTITNTGSLTHAGGAAALTQSTGGNTTIDGAAATLTGVADINAGTLNVATGGQLTADTGASATTDVDIAAGATLDIDTGGTLVGNVANAGTSPSINDGTLTGDLANSGTFDNNGSVSGTITNTGTLNHSGGAGALTQNTTGNTTIDGAAATVTGLVDINAGRLNITNGNQLSADTGGTLTTDVDIAAGATLDIDTGGTLVGNVANAGTSPSINDGTLTGDLANSGTFDNNGSVSGTITNTGTLNHSGGAGALTQNTTGNTTIDGAAATVTGLVDINAGTLNITNGNQLSADTGGTLTTDVDIASGGTLDIDSGGTLVGNVANASSSASVNDGTLTGDLANSGSFDNNGTVSGTITNTGSLTHAGGAAALTQNTGGNTTIDGAAATLTGVADINAGTLNVATGGQLTADTGGTNATDVDVSGTAVLDNDGAIVGNVLLQASAANPSENAGTITGDFQIDSGRLDIDGNSTITGVSTINAGEMRVLDGFSLTTGAAGGSANELTLASGATIEVGTGSTLANSDTTETMTFDSGSNVVLYNNATLGGAVIINGMLRAEGGTSTSTNAGSPAAIGVETAGTGSATINGNVTLGSSGTIDLADGSIGDSLTINGTLTASAGTVNLDANLALGSAATDVDTVTVTGVSTGTLTIVINDVTTGIYGDTGTNVRRIVDLAAGSSVTPVLGSIPIDPTNTYVYSLGSDGEDIFLNATLNSATVGLVGAIGSAQTLISAVINRPTSPFITTLNNVEADQGCNDGAWFRYQNGYANATGTSEAGITSVTADTRSRYSGFQFGTDKYCFDFTQDPATDDYYGLIFGYNQASTEQDVPNSVTGQIDSVTQLDLEQFYGGVYYAAVRGNLSYEVQARAEMTNYTINSKAMNGVALPVDDTTFSTNAYTLSGSAAYQYGLGENSPFVVVPNIGFSITRTAEASVDLDNGARIEFDENINSVLFAGATLAYGTADEATGTSTFVFGTLTRYFNLSEDSTSTVIDSAGNETKATSTALPDYSELSLGYQFNREYGSVEAGNLRKFSAAIRADGRVGTDFESGAITAQIRFQF